MGMSLHNMNEQILLLLVTLCIYPALTADGCSDSWGGGGLSVRCGDQCTGVGGYCTCGKDAAKFNFRDNTSWCCGASMCERKGNFDIVCEEGSLLPLTTPCQGECNTGIGFDAARQYWSCDSKDQCIKIQHVSDKVHHCHDSSDEMITQDVYTPIQWDKLTTCYLYGDEDRPGVRCSGQGMPGDCQLYSRWCNENTVLKCSELGGLTTVHTEVCSNKTFWLNHPCTSTIRGVQQGGRRCSAEYSGQCYYPNSTDYRRSKTCKDGSHNIPYGSDKKVIVESYDSVGDSVFKRNQLLAVLVSSVVTILFILS